MAPRIQFQTVTIKKYTEVQWSDDYGQTWHHPEDARDAEVIAGFERIAAKREAIARDAAIKRTTLRGMHGRSAR